MHLKAIVPISVSLFVFLFITKGAIDYKITDQRDAEWRALSCLVNMNDASDIKHAVKSREVNQADLLPMLLELIRKGDEVGCRKLLEVGVNPRESDKTGMSGIRLAVSLHRTHIIPILAAFDKKI